MAGKKAGNASGKAQATGKWEAVELRKFYGAYHKYGTSWGKVARSLGNRRSAQDCEQLYKQHQSFLGLPSNPQLEQAFVAMVNDMYNNEKDNGSDTVSEEAASQMVDAGTSPAAARKTKSNRTSRPPPPRSAPPQSVRSPAVGDARSNAGTPVSKLSSPGSGYGRYKVTSPPSGRFQSPSVTHKTRPPAGNSSSKKKRGRRLFPEDQDEIPQYRSYMGKWGGAEDAGAADDVGEGVDALLSLASMPHASSSCATDPANPRVPEEDPASPHGATSHKARTPNKLDYAKLAGEGIFVHRTGTPGQTKEFILASPLTVSPRSGVWDAQRRAGGAAGRPKPLIKGPRTDALNIRSSMVKQSPAVGILMQHPIRKLSDATPQSPDPSLKPQHELTLAKKTESSVSRQARARQARLGKPMKALSVKQPPRSQSLIGSKRNSSAMSPPQSPSKSVKWQAHPDGEAVKVVAENRADAQVMDTVAGPSGTTAGEERAASVWASKAEADKFPISASDKVERPIKLKPKPSIGRVRQRKPGPEKYPPIQRTSPLKSLFQRALIGQPRSSLLFASSSGTALTRLGSMPSSKMVGETGDVMTPLEIRLRHCLGHRVRRWCMYEFVVSAIDRPWFQQNEMQNLASKLHLGPDRLLTKREWGVLRSSFGKPRRLSLDFLREERTRLEQYREHVRRQHMELTSGSEVPIDLPRPLKVGQEVVARHPFTHNLHDGVILTVKGDKYRVQFNRSELLSEMVHDFEVMPVDPADNLPASMWEHLKAGGAAPSRRTTNMVPARGPAAGRAQQEARAAAALAEVHNRETDARLLTELAAALDNKEALLVKLREMNEQAESKGQQAQRGVSGQEFEKHYAVVVMGLQDLNLKLQDLLGKLQSRAHLSSPHLLPSFSTSFLLQMANSTNTANAPSNLAGGTQPSSTTPVEEASGPGGSFRDTMGLSGSEEASAAVLVESALHEARSVVQKYRSIIDKATAALANGAGASGDNAASGVNPPHSPSAAAQDNADPGSKDSEQERSKQPSALKEVLSQVDQSLNRKRTTPLHGTTEDGWLIDVITGCVGMLFTVQRCTGNAGPEGVVEKSLDLALQWLKPHSENNLGVYQEIADTLRLLKSELTKVH